MIVATAVVTVSLVLVVLTALLRDQGVAYAFAHMAVCAATALALAWHGWWRTTVAVNAGASERQVSATLARGMGVVWIWGLACLLATYATGIVQWYEWGRFALAFGVAGALAIGMASVLGGNRGDPARVLAISRYFGIAQLIGMTIVMVGLVVDRKMERFLEIQRIPWQDWAANNYFFFGALALAILSAYGLRVTRTTATVRHP